MRIFKNTKKILVVEDEKILSELYRDKLTSIKFEVLSASTAPEALDIVKKEKPKLILLDILLPGENGIYILKKLKEAKSSVPVVVFSNYDNLDARDEAFKLGAKAYLIKTNYTPNEIVKEIKKYL